MLHLFDNKFLQLDKYINTFNYRVVISEKYGTDDLKNTSLYPKTLNTGKNFEDALGKGNDVDFLIRMLFDFKEKVVIFADIKTYAKIITIWLKSTTNMDKETFGTYADCFAHKESKLHNDVLFNNISTIMKSEWENSPQFDFSDLDYMPSIEFLFASAFYDINFNKKVKLQTQLTKFIKRQYEFHILEARSYIDTFILDADMQEILGGRNKTINNYYELTRMSIYRQPFFVEDITTFPGQGYLPGSNSKLDLSLASNKEIKELCELTDDVALSYIGLSKPSGSLNFSSDHLPFLVNRDLRWPVWVSEETKKLILKDFFKQPLTTCTAHDTWKYMAAVQRGILTDEEYITILDEILSEPMGMSYVNIEENIILTLVTYFKSLKQTSSNDKLRKFTLK